MAKKSGKKLKKESVAEKVQAEVKEMSKEVTKESKISFKEHLKKTKDLLFNLNKFLNSIEDERGYQKVLAFFVVSYLAYFILSSLIGLIFIKVTLIEYLKNIFIGFVFAVIISVLYPFLFSGIFHVGTLIFRGKERFFNTFKPTAYSLFIWVIYLTAILIITTVIQLIMPFETTMIDNLAADASQEVIGITYQQFLEQPGALYTLIVSIVLLIVSMIHQLIFLTMGIAKFQKLSKLKALLSIVIIPVALLLMIIISFVILSLIGFG